MNDLFNMAGMDLPAYLGSKEGTNGTTIPQAPPAEEETKELPEG